MSENNMNDTNTENTEIESTESVETTLEAQDAEGDQLEAEAAEEEKAPAWMQFTAALNAHAAALGLQVAEQKGFTKYINAETGHKLYVAKQGRAVKRVDTTLPILGQDGTYPLSKPNGKIECHVVAELETVTKVLEQLADSSVGKIRAAKRAPKAEAPAADAPADSTETV
jgi:hypothetical protein